MRRMSVALKRASALGVVVVEPLVVVLLLSAPLSTFLFLTSDIAVVTFDQLTRSNGSYMPGCPFYSGNLQLSTNTLLGMIWWRHEGKPRLNLRVVDPNPECSQ